MIPIAIPSAQLSLIQNIARDGGSKLNWGGHKTETQFDPWHTWNLELLGTIGSLVKIGFKKTRNGFFEIFLHSFKVWQKKKIRQYQEYLFVFLSKSGTL